MIVTRNLGKYLSTFDEKDFSTKVCKVISGKSAVSRYKAWDYCYIFFRNLYVEYLKNGTITEEEKDLACLNLSSYLASWGMIRNSFIGNFNYKIYEKLVSDILSADIELWNIDDELAILNLKYSGNIFAISKDADIDKLVCLIYDFGEKVKADLKYFASSFKKNVTDTLVTKIMLGTLGCMPGLDTYFKLGMGFSGDSFTKGKIKIILLIAIKNLSAIRKKQDYVKDSKNINTQYKFSVMKLLDIYYFEKGK